MLDSSEPEVVMATLRVMKRMTVSTKFEKELKSDHYTLFHKLVDFISNTNEEIVALALWTMSNALAANPKFQSFCSKQNVVKTVLRSLRRTQHPGIVLHSIRLIRNMVSQNVSQQDKLIEMGGIDILATRLAETSDPVVQVQILATLTGAMAYNNSVQAAVLDADLMNVLESHLRSEYLEVAFYAVGCLRNLVFKNREGKALFVDQNLGDVLATVGVSASSLKRLGGVDMEGQTINVSQLAANIAATQANVANDGKEAGSSKRSNRTPKFGTLKRRGVKKINA
eukprot:TRINITY_DN4156_c0_g4_i1.p1 TRINITY_DN4156_c0_g4~~TRINITY_DN4156_c0_g4_i1.p1  ORF type:complete len:283 (+),score=108.82 TRINITY_DN4156_c0_g4_i1:82-930(+)